ncbi:MAG: gluconokinase [Candidatus Dadabacteria bacterium]|nr:gluconokinase [Candidatus Dadabacteria bacterium]
MKKGSFRYSYKIRVCDMALVRDPLIVILMGVSGSGKTTIGELLAEKLGWMFYDGDDFHPESNKEKMKRGIPLTDEDRDPWLNILKQLIHDLIEQRKSAVVACSALKQSYRDRLLENSKGVVLVYLKGGYGLIETRLHDRKGHFFNAKLLESQFETLEEPKDVFTIYINHEPDAIVDEIRRKLGL